MSAASPTLSIVIPSRSRTDYLRAAVRSILDIAALDVEVIVEENGSTGERPSFAESELTDTLKHAWSTQPRSMVENFDEAVSRATGEYVTVLGDDDTIAPGLLTVARWAAAQGHDAVVASNVAHYVWPDLRLGEGRMKPGQLVVRPFTGHYHPIVPEDEMRKCVRSGGQDFAKLPRPYYGLIRRSCWSELRRDTGTFFPGVSPDMAASLALANYTPNTWWIDYPLFLPGSSLRSNAGLSGLKQHIGKLEDQPHLMKMHVSNWSTLVPKFYSVETIWAEAAVGALSRTRRFDLIREFGIPKLYAQLLARHRDYSRLVCRQFYPATRAAGQDSALATARLLGQLAMMASRRAVSVMRRFRAANPVAPLLSTTALPDIRAAGNALRRFLDGRAPSLEDLLRS